MGTSKGLFWAVCIVCICSSRGYTGGVVGAWSRGKASSSSRRQERSLELCLNKRSLVAALTRDDDKISKGKFIKQNEYERIIGIARKEIGVVERTGKNDGARIAEYLAYCNIKSPAPWCAAWVSWVFEEAGYSKPRTAWSPALFPKEKLVSLDSLQALNDKKKHDGQGLVYGIWFGSLKRIGHCGIVESLRADWVNGIEGNTNVQGSREGDGVWRRIRHRRTIYCFADWLK